MNEQIDSRVARLEASVSHIEKDISDIKIDIREFRKEMWSHLRWSIGTTVTIFGILVGIMAKGFHWL